MNWERKPFLDVVTDITSGNKKFQSAEYLSDGKYPIIDQGADIIAGYTNEYAVVERTKPIILFGDHTKKIQFVDYDFCLGADGVKVLNTSDSLLPKFLYYYLQTVNLPDVGYSRHYKFLKECNIPLPPLPIQQQIADTLDKADALRRKDQELLDKYDELAQAVFYEMFGDVATNEMRWERTNLGAACTTIKDGPHTSPKYVVDGIPFISVNNIISGNWDTSKVKYISEEDYHVYKKRCEPQYGDVMYTKGGTTGFAKFIDVKWRFINWVHIAILKFSKEKLNGRFLESMLNTTYCYQQSQRLTRGIANRDLVLGEMKKIEIFIPPIEIQEQFSRIIESIYSQKAILSNNINKSVALQKSTQLMFF